ncbi:MAG: hypothetical protein Q8K78_03725 [Planctomycetaceae bacterium]|nr:hypothetical protein [Planctomycetaceae bacterium]
MVRRSIAVLGAVSVAIAATCLVLSGTSATWAAGKQTAKRPLKKLTYDPNAEEVDLFKGMESGQLKVKLIPQNSFGGNVLIENTTDKPLTVKFPAAMVGVPKHLAQFGGGGFGGGGQGGFGGGQQGGLGGGGGQQQTGGGIGGQQGGFGGGQQGGGGGFFGGGAASIPPEQIGSLPFNSVCLQHGKPDPTVKAEYTLVPVEKFSNDPVLKELLATVGTGKVDSQTAQAAAWHLTDKMSWDQLANKALQHTGGAPPTPYFTQAQLFGAQALLAHAKKKAEENPTPKTVEPIRSGRTTAAAN